MSLTKAVAAIGALLFATAANAAVVLDFSSLTGNNGDAFNSTTESGYDITASTTAWREAHGFGNPVPSIFTVGTLTHTISVARSGGGIFNLLDVDFGCGFGADNDCTGTVEGLLSGGQQFLSSTGLLDNSGTFSTFSPGLGAFNIDTLLISINQDDSNIDNIHVRDVAAVPAPAVAALMLFGLAGLIRRRRGAA